MQQKIKHKNRIRNRMRPSDEADQEDHEGFVDEHNDLIDIAIENDADDSEIEDQEAPQSNREVEVEPRHDYRCPLRNCSKPISINIYTKGKIDDIRKAKEARDMAKCHEFLLDLHNYHEKMDHEQEIHDLGESNRWPLMLTVDVFPARVAKFTLDILPLITRPTTLFHCRLFREFLRPIEDDEKIWVTKKFRKTTAHAG